MSAHINLPHIVLQGPTANVKFTSSAQQGASIRLPMRNREDHVAFLQRKFNSEWERSERDFVVSHAVRQGVYLQFKSSPGFDLKIQSLEDMRSKKIRLCNVRKVSEPIVDRATGTEEDKEVVYATVFVANEKRQFFLNKFNQYATQDLESGNPKNGDLINGIDDLQKAIAQSFWLDDTDLLPGETSQWCEVWLSSDTPEVETRFVALLGRLQILHREGRIRFPERTVKLIYANNAQLETLTLHSDDIAEFRRAKETAKFWVEQSNREQSEWVQDFVNRIVVDRESLHSICILDTGINNGHPMLQLVLDHTDCHSYDQNWGVHDHQGHGTLMAGLAAFGNIEQYLEDTDTIEVLHVLESVKILPPPPHQNNPELWGDITSQAISRAEIQAPLRNRIICMAVTSLDNRDRGRPSSWSGKLDQVCSGSEDGNKRLMIVSAGNYSSDDIRQIGNYPSNQQNDSIHDPAQAWNVVSVGAYTQLTNVTDPTLRGHAPIADVNQLSPFTTTSYSWDPKWPIKPEVVFEGGNAVVDSSGFVSECNDLSLVSTFYQPRLRHFESFRMTSAATSQAAHFAAKIQVKYPNYWAETIRALMIHSAEWPDQLKRQFASDDSKGQIANVLRVGGYGVPNLDRAINCASNSLTLVSQAEMQPYEISIEHRNGKRQKNYKTKDMHFYNLPWPTEELMRLGATPVQMRITLSYFIEPGPGEVGWKDRYRYPSHLLRFDLNSPEETQDEFLRRINAAVRDEENGHPGTSSAADHWVIGSQNRDKGSIHSDIWNGTAVDLAASNMIAVFPRIGWWRERTHLGKMESPTRYALIVSIRTPEQGVDIYTPVSQMVSPLVPVGIRTEV